MKSPTTTFPKTDPTAPAFWNHRFEAAFTPWDQGGVPACLLQYVESPQQVLQTKQRRVLIPGCGSAYEVKCLADLGYVVKAIDFSPAGVAQAQRILGAEYRGLIHEEDFFGEGLGYPLPRNDSRRRRECSAFAAPYWKSTCLSGKGVERGLWLGRPCRCECIASSF